VAGDTLEVKMMRQRSWSLSLWSVLPVVVVTLTALTPLEAQTTDPDTPASSPLWWTLTDDISPQELRRSFRDRQGNLQRYLEALEKGAAEPLPAAQLDYLSYFHSGALHPELLPMWEAFDAFALRFRYHQGWPDKAPRELRAFGISPQGAEAIISRAHQHLASVDRLILEIGDQQGELMALARRASEVLGDQAVRMALKEHRPEVIAQATDRPLGQVKKLMDVWEIDPTAASSEELLPELEEVLDSEDWGNLRRYLLREVAPGTSAIDFDYSEKIR
jgi:hypothetical protein